MHHYWIRCERHHCLFLKTLTLINGPYHSASVHRLNGCVLVAPTNKHILGGIYATPSLHPIGHTYYFTWPIVTLIPASRALNGVYNFINSPTPHLCSFTLSHLYRYISIYTHTCSLACYFHHIIPHTYSFVIMFWQCLPALSRQYAPLCIMALRPPHNWPFYSILFSLCVLSFLYISIYI